jgi:hypothetical protein
MRARPAPLIRRCAGAVIILCALGRSACAGEARFLAFEDEVKRAREAIGQDAECRVIIEETEAWCRKAPGTPEDVRIQIYFRPEQRNTVSFASASASNLGFFNSVGRSYDIPFDTVLQCFRASALPQYIGDYEVQCNGSSMTLLHARRF